MWLFQQKWDKLRTLHKHTNFLWLRGVVFFSALYAQEIQIDTVFPSAVTQWPLPKGWLLPNSVELQPARAWRYDTLHHTLHWERGTDSLRVRLRLYRFPSGVPRYQPLPWSALERWDSLAQAAPAPTPASRFLPPADTFTPTVHRNGTLVRSLTVGTGQNATLNSAFRLNLEGLIAPDLYLIAALTDENLPFQTAATQTFSDFDRVNIGLRWRDIQLLLGDLEIKETRSRFANFYRNVLGVETKRMEGRHRPHLALAEAKGTFYTNSFMGQEGRQGPYPLTGKNGERFIPILAGSEKVYVNGVLMRRGQDQDYVIDYTVGEITFTPRVPITAATRIVVDFEYADRSYGRSFVWIEDSWSGERLQVTASYFRQADNLRRPLDFSLSPAEEAFLASLPPEARVGVLPGIDTLPYEAGAIRYAARDTVIGGDTLRYFVLSQDSAQALYQVSFVYVGAGKGDYTREATSLNGNAFRWVGPGAGDYRIGKAIPLPTAIEVVSLRHRGQLPLRLVWEGEIDGSRYVSNRFAGHTQQDVALRQTLRWQALPDSARWSFSPEISLQYVGAKYQNADRVYEREYGRLWNYNDLGQRAVERLVETRLPLTVGCRYRLTPHLGWRSWGDSLRNTRYAALWEGLDTLKGLGGHLLFEHITAQSRSGADRWIRTTGRVFYTQGQWQAGTAVWTEWRRSALVDSANFRFYEYTPYLRYQGERWRFRIACQWRREWQARPRESPPTEGFRFASYMPQAELAYTSKQLSFSTTTTYRLFLPGDSVFGLTLTRTLLSQNTVRLRLKPWEVEGFYQVSAEQTPQRQILYVAVNPGQGTHEWRDLNGDRLQQIEEFFPAVNPLLANYIAVSRATGRFIPAVALSMAMALRWQPEKRLRWLSYQLNTRLDQRQNAPDRRWYRYLPASPPRDTSFVQWTLLHRQDLFLFRTATRGDQTFSFQYQLSQLMPLSGLQRQRVRQYSSRTRYTLSRAWGLELQLLRVDKESTAPQQAEMNYAYEGYDCQPQAVYQPSGRWRTTVGIAYRERRVQVPFPARVAGLKLPIEQRWSWKAGAFVGLRVEPAWYQGPHNLPALLLLDILEGLRPGRNLFTSVTVNLPVSRFVELSLLYEGRFTAREPVHSARMQARANF